MLASSIISKNTASTSKRSSNFANHEPQAQKARTRAYTLPGASIYGALFKRTKPGTPCIRVKDADPILEGETIAIVGRNRRAIKCVKQQVNSHGGDEVIFATPEDFLGAVALENLHVNACLMIQDDYLGNEYSVTDLAQKLKSVAPHITIFGLSELLRRNDVAKRRNQIIDGLMKMPLQPSIFRQALA